MRLDPGGLARIRQVRAHRCAQLLGRRGGIVGLADPGLGLDDLPQPPVRNALPVGKATAAPPRADVSGVLERALELPDKTALADPGPADDCDELDCLVPFRTRQRVAEERELVLASDERRERRPLLRRAHGRTGV